MAVVVSNTLRTIIDEKWHTRIIPRGQGREIAMWCFERMGYPMGQLDPRTFDYNQRWHIEEPTRNGPVKEVAFIAFKHEQDLTMYLLRWGSEE